MEHTVEELAPFTLIGLGLDCPGFDNSGIGALWSRFNARAGELPPGRVWGVGLPRENGFYYIAGHQVPDGTAVPEGMEATEVPGGRYFRLEFHDSPAQLGPAYSRIFSELLPAAGLKTPRGPVCLEDYPADFMDEAAGTFRINLYVQLAKEAEQSAA